MKKRYIWFWHGKDDKLVEKISSFCHLEMLNEKETYCFDGSLDDFEKLYGNMFIVMKDFICITQYNTFGAR